MNTSSKLTFVKKNLITLAISSMFAPLTAYAADDTAEGIEVIEVKGRAAQYYFIDEATMATKTPTSFMDLPQSVQVLSEELINDQAARQVTDLYRSISGMSQFSYSGVTARGFRQDQVRYDGVQGDPYSGFSIPQLFNVEQVEVLKGPTGMLYGAGQPGGLLNYVTKKPTFENTAEVALFAGNDSLLGGSIESTGAIANSESFAYRIGAFHQGKDSYRNNAEEDNTLVSTGISWVASNNAEFIFQYDYIDQDLSGHRLRGVPVDDNGNFLTDISYSANEASDFQRLEADVFQLTGRFDISDKLTNTTVFRTFSNERTQQYHENLGLIGDLDDATKAASVPLLNAFGYPAEDTAMLRQFRDQYRQNDEWSLTTDFVYETSFDGIEHTLLFGSDYAQTDAEYVNRVSDLTLTTNPVFFDDPSEIANPAIHVPTLDILNPVYGQHNTDDYKMIDVTDSETESKRLGIYLQDQIRVNDHWIAVVGARYDKFDDKDVTGNFSVDDDKISPRIGAVYQPNENTSIFANYTQGFNPQSLSSQPEVGETFEPETSTQNEIGIKNVWLDGNLTSTVAVYHIVKEDVTVSNPAFVEGSGAPEQLQIGEVTSKGIEVDIVGDITENWTGTINYAYNDATITGGNPDDISNTVGDEFANAPDHMLGMWTRYALPQLNSSFAIGFDYVDEQLSLDGQKVKSYTVWDASWQTNIDSFEIQVNLKNIFDKEYAVSGFNKRNGHFPGEPRSILVQVSYAF